MRDYLDASLGKGWREMEGRVEEGGTEKLKRVGGIEVDSAEW